MFSFVSKVVRTRERIISQIFKTISVASYSNKCSNNNIIINDKNEKSIDDSGSLASKYREFRNEDSKVNLDVNEQPFTQEYSKVNEEDVFEEFSGLIRSKGVTGVKEIEDLVEALKRENVQNIFVSLDASELRYVYYICVVTGKSYSHMLAIAQFVRKLYKEKRHFTDISPKIKGKYKKEWIAMNLGNVSLQIFSQKAREKYDFDSVLSLGEKPDDPIDRLLMQHSIKLKDLFFIMTQINYF